MNRRCETRCGGFAFTTANIMSGRMMSPETGVGSGAGEIDASGGGEMVRIGDGGCTESPEASSLRSEVASVATNGRISAMGDSVIGETMTAGGGETALSSSSSSSG